MKVYNELFENWSNIQSEFRTNEPEPEQVLYAFYEYESYLGSADVYYRNGDKFYHVSGSHCSCHGLERQWEPEEYDKQTFIGLMNRLIEQSIKNGGEGALYKFILSQTGGK